MRIEAPREAKQAICHIGQRIASSSCGLLATPALILN